MTGVRRCALQVLPPVLVALVVFQTLRSCWLERYVVSSGSMEPLLQGDPVSGDRVLVDKSVSSSWTPARGDLVVMRNPDDPDSYVVKRVLAWGGERVRLMQGDVFLWDPVSGDRVLVDKSVSSSWTPGRGDLVVMRNPDDPDTYVVKRVLAWGGERVRLMQGDVFLWDPELRDWRRWEKDPLEFRDMRMTYFQHPDGGEEPVEGFLHGLEESPEPGELVVPEAGRDLESLRQLLTGEARRKRLREHPPNYHLPGHLATSQAVDTRFLDGRGVLRGEALLCQDLGLELDVVAEAGLEGLQLVFEYQGEYYAWLYHADGRVQFHRGSEPYGDPVAAEPLRAGQLVRIEIGYLDGHFFLITGDRLHGRWKLDLPLFGDPAPPTGLGTVPNNLLHLGSAGAPLHLARLRVFHDVYYQSLPRPFHQGDVDVPAGELWLLGDNTFDSRDSRSKGGFPRDDLVGRPIAILGPLRRFRILPR